MGKKLRKIAAKNFVVSVVLMKTFDHVFDKFRIHTLNFDEYRSLLSWLKIQHELKRGI